MKKQIVTALAEVPLSMSAAELAAIEGGMPSARTYGTSSTKGEREPLTRDQESKRYQDYGNRTETPYGYGTFSSRQGGDTFRSDSYAPTPKEYFGSSRK